MIVALIAGLAIVIFKVVFDLFDFTSFTGLSSVMAAIDILFETMKEGIGIINFFLPIADIRLGLGIFIFLWSVLHSYHFVIFILKKIPMLSIE